MRRLFGFILVFLLLWQIAGAATGSEPDVIVKPPPSGIETLFRDMADGLSKVIFFDPFSYAGIYDPVVRDQGGVPLLEMSAQGELVPKTAPIPLIVIWLIFGGVFFTFKLGFINLRGMGHAMRIVRGDYYNVKHGGEVSHFQAVSAALSATIGLGNIAGVAVAISLGGPGAMFWIVVAGFLGMSTKFAECTLGVKYREIKNGVVYGGPMYYLKNGLAARGLRRTGLALSFLYAGIVMVGSFGIGSLFQANQVAAQMVEVAPWMSGNEVWLGIALAFFAALVIIGGVKSIARFASRIVPFMMGLYLLCAVIIISVNYHNILPSFGLIWDGAFTPEAAKGGFFGVLIIGFRRALFSNEAGMGTSSIAHSAVKTNEPVTEGYAGLLEPFLDTVVICSLTALVIVVSGVDSNIGVEGAKLTSQAFASVIPWFPYVLFVIMLLFAFSTITSYSYFGLRGWTYIFPQSKTSEMLYKAIFLLVVVVGTVLSLGVIIDLTDMLLLAMTFPNLLGLFIMSGEIKKDLKRYREKIKSGLHLAKTDTYK